MARARKQQVSLTETPYYHCISRCVRRAFLCGEDKVTGTSFEHRRGWIEDKLLLLGKVFAIDVCAYAIMSNHSHIVLFVNEAEAKLWSLDEVLTRWHQLFKGTLITQQYLRGEKLSKPMLLMLTETVEVYRQRLQDISWFMRILNEDIARKSNAEDNCTGRFWEGRFKSQALLDEAALAACMAYVDLNPIRAKIASTPENSDYTSIQRRIKAAVEGKQSTSLFPFIGNPKQAMPTGLPFELVDYIQLVELTGRCIRENKPGYIKSNLPNILQRLNIGTDNWLMITRHFSRCFHGAVGHERQLTKFYQHQKLKKRATISACRKFLA